MSDPLFLAFLAQHDDGAWRRAVDRLEHAIHPVDRSATRIWFHLYPLRLQHALETSRDAAALEDYLRLEGRWRLAEDRNTSHWFFFGHRYWTDVCAAVRAFAAQPGAPGSLDLAAQVQQIARGVAERLNVDVSWLVGITAVSVRTLQQVGLPATATGVAGTNGRGGVDPDRIASRRDAGGVPGLLTRLLGRRRQFTVTFDERTTHGTFPLIDSQHLTTAAALDTRDYRAADPRCSEGPIPVQCRSSSCGTCWVGLLAGARHVSAMGGEERRTLTALGYSDAEESHPSIRLACMAEVDGDVSIVIPTWNGQVGARLQRHLRAQKLE